MFLVLRTRRIRLYALRALYREYCIPNTPEARGRYLLRHWLSTSQREQFDANDYFDVIGCDTGRRYRINYGRTMNVHELDEAGRFKIGWCFLPKDYVAAGDVMLAQKIALETFECDALAVAQRFVPKSFSLQRERALRILQSSRGNTPSRRA